MLSGISRRDLIKKFKSLDFEGPLTGGKHQFMTKGNLKVRIPNPHQSDISVGLVKQILRQANISDAGWDSI